MDAKKKRLAMLLCIGILGSVSAMIGDCLLLGVDSTGAADLLDKFVVIASKLSYTRIGLAGFFGFIGIPVSTVGFFALYLLMEDRNSGLAKAYLFSLVSSYMGLGGAVHIICCYLITGVKKNLEVGAENVVLTTVMEQIGYLIPCLIVFFALYAVSTVTLMLIIGKGKTMLPRWMWVLNPPVFKVLINAVGKLGTSAFFNGLACSNMNLGSIIILCAWLIVVLKGKQPAADWA